MGWNERKFCVSDEDGGFNDQADETIDWMIPVQSLQPTFPGARSTDRSLQPRLFTTRPGPITPRSGAQVSFESYLAGAQRDTATGAQVHTHQTKMLADGLGGSDLTQVGGVAGAAASATAMAAATGTRARGGIVTLGEAGDGRAEGQGAVVGNPSTALLTALPAAPNAGDKIRACLMLFLAQTLGTSKRFVLEYVAEHDSAERQFKFTGGHLASLGIRISNTDLTVLTWNYQFAFWQESDISTPTDETDLEQCDTAPSDGGSYFLQPVGTATRTENVFEAATRIDLTLNMGLVAIEGQVEGLRGCNIRDFKRTKPVGVPAAELAITHPTDTDLLDIWDKGGSDSDYFHFLATLAAGGGTAHTEGRQALIYAPNMFYIGERLPPVEYNAQTYMTSLFGLTEGPDKTNDLTKSCLRIGVK